MAQSQKRILPFEGVVLVLQGGGALGAYQAGVFQALDEAGIPLNWLCGVSIGAINAALIAGSPPDRRVAHLREFWEAVTQPAPASGFPWLANPLWPSPEDGRIWANRMSAFGTMLYGARNFFSPRPVPPLGSSAEKPDLVSYYDISPLEATLTRLVDFDLINAKAIRLSVGATHVRTGQPIWFENTERDIAPHHIIASASLPPGFPATEVDGEYYWDGGVVSNTPMQWVVDNRPHSTGLVFQVDLWDATGEVPLDIAAANMRAMEIHSASRINISVEQYRKMQQIRSALGKILEQIPEDRRNEPEFLMLAEEAHATVATLVQLKYETKKYELASKIFEFSRRGMEEHWKAGHDDMRAVLEQPGVLELPHASEGLRVFTARRGAD
ncbi:MAG: patatin-like phospholipase family protein [Xanthobacteraceae bacterium]|jgi:NTE family protein